MTRQPLPHIVIVGAGFGGLETARRLAKAPVRITLIDRQNYHLFQPLLYQIAIAGLAPSQIAYPLRAIFRRQKNLTFQMGEVTNVDFEKRYIKMNGSVLAYDTLVLAAGGQTNFFGLKAIEQNALELKNIESAVAARNHLLSMFEQASREADPDKRRTLLTFVIVGGGPTGVETAGALAELIRLVLSKDYPKMDLNDMRVLLLEATDHLMGNYPNELRKATFDLLRRKNVEILLNTKLADYNGTQITLGDGTCIPTHTLIWTAGVKAAELIDQLGIQQAGAGRVRVESTLQLPGHPEVFVIGDAAYLENGDRQPLPMLATVAQQEARAATKNIRRMLKGQKPEPFYYKDPGLLATIGRNAAVARIAGLSFSGFPAWLIWVVLHIYRLIGFRNRLAVLINWAWDYFFYETQVRLITRE
ncbi:MAG: pyridine nucleotide-disulfide oxidoreductase [Gallionellales bacterium RBG_16_56_9]|nr:MAG: pyridine nucleotide-disulfide oxidoreductase [Gallionellales bacterium RBG_16_56_9]